MARNGSVNFRDLDRFRQQVESSLGANQVDQFIEQKNLLQGCLQKLSKGHLLDNIPKVQEKKVVL